MYIKYNNDNSRDDRKIAEITAVKVLEKVYKKSDSLINSLYIL